MGTRLCTLALTFLAAIVPVSVLASPMVANCDESKRPVDVGKFLHSQQQIEDLAWAAIGISRSQARLEFVCIDTTTSKQWVLNFLARDTEPPSTHWTVAIEDKSGKTETLIGH
jgi:hypothetical protein